MNWKSESAPAQGYVAPGFEPVAEEFARNFSERKDVGAAFAATHEGKLVVDLWGGAAAPGTPWAADTLQVIYSGTKGLMAACVLKLVERGQLDLNDPVADYWPEFAQAGKGRVLVRHVTSHTAGLPGVHAPLTADDYTDYEKMEALLAAQPLVQDPNGYRCYHPVTIGWLVGALVRRIDGRTIGSFFADEIAAPLGLEAYIGLPEALEPRVGRIELGEGMLPFDEAFSDAQRQDPVFASAWGNPPLFPQELAWNTRAYHAAEIAGAGGIADARSMARFYGCMAAGGSVDGVTVLRPETVALGRSEHSRFMDPYIAEAMAFGVCWALQTPQGRFGPAPDAFGHSGAGGSIHGGWPTEGCGFSYVMNQMRGDPEDLRSRHVLKRLHEIVRA
ncbi:serine hydrolase [Devosia sp. ZB163]|uniref:serine hydrolase domain-containing protein n=1 Tax=Devosia sp. ZB163 TaxID=3025938 RepID=UPI002360E56E|nr:serine hydrolase domain-containing protein [Devosia sp. ZB163]MDC9822743.1 serine hydrolase [Devosia sp. ZB163]